MRGLHDTPRRGAAAVDSPDLRGRLPLTRQTRRRRHGACEFAGWVNPGNPTDCRAKLHVHTNAFWGGGECRATSFEARSNVYTCVGRRGDYCGGAGPHAAGEDPVCFCDDSCTVYGDCCPDYHLICE